jgi:hypothetical protein
MMYRSATSEGHKNDSKMAGCQIRPPFCCQACAFPFCAGLKILLRGFNLFQYYRTSVAAQQNCAAIVNQNQAAI